MPFIRAKPENEFCRLFAISDTDRAAWEARHLDAVTIGVAL